MRRHTAFFKELGAAGKCLIAGLFADQTTELGDGCYVLTAESKEEAEQTASDDPLIGEGLYDFRMREWMKVVPE